MIHTSMNIFDLGVLLVIGLSAILSFYRGFMREILSLFSWVGAAVVSLYTFPSVSHAIEPQVKNPAVASGLASMGMFIAMLILFSILSGLIVKYIKPRGEVGFLDNLIGLTFGVARGVLLVAIGYFIMTLVVTEKDYPEWVKHAGSRHYVSQVSNWVAKLAPSYLEIVTDKVDAAKHSDTESDVDEGEEETPTVVKKHIQEDAPTGKNLPTLDDLKHRIHDQNGDK